MKKLTEYVHQRGKVRPLLTLVAGELGRNLKDVSKSLDLSVGEKEVLTQWLETARLFCETELDKFGAPDSVRGAIVRKKVYVELRSDVDFLSVMEDGRFFNTEMKSALKPNSYGPFAGAKAFADRVAVKFDQLEDALSRDGEEFSSLRALLVSDSHFDILQTAVNDLRSAEEICSSDGKKHDYLLCTLKGLVDFRLRKGVTEEVFRFRL